MMKILNSVIIFLIGGLFLIGCGPKDEPDYVLPKSYLPAYPGSYWHYTNGDQILTSSNYVLHSYQSSIESIESTKDVYVPKYNGQFLYEYNITQNSTVYPVMKLLEETTGSAWIIREINGEPIKRQVITTLDSVVMPWPPYIDSLDMVFHQVVAVVEFVDSLGKDRWNLKEYYAKNVGLIRVEANNPFDTLGPIVLKDLQKFEIVR